MMLRLVVIIDFVCTYSSLAVHTYLDIFCKMFSLTYIENPRKLCVLISDYFWNFFKW